MEVIKIESLIPKLDMERDVCLAKIVSDEYKTSLDHIHFCWHQSLKKCNITIFSTHLLSTQFQMHEF